MENNWKTLSSEDQIDQIIADSDNRPQIIYKHSTRCSASSQAYRRLKLIDPEITQAADIYYLDVIASRPVSNAVAGRFGIPHESPQLLVIKDSHVVWHKSHYEIQSDAVMEAVKVFRETQ